MTRTHSSLKPSTNIIMIIIWGVLGFSAIMAAGSYSYTIVFIGLLLGAICGYMQNMALAESIKIFAGTSSLSEISATLKNMKWGQRYITFLWLSYSMLIALSLLVENGNFLLIIIAGSLSLMFIREITTLKALFKLSGITNKNR